MGAEATASPGVPPSYGLSASRLAGLRALLSGPVERGEIAGAIALLARGDAVHVETAGMADLAAGRPMRRDTIVRIASMTKPILATAAMMLVEQGTIGLDDPVERWLPEFANRRVLRALDAAFDDTVPARRPITLRDLLTLRFGLGAVMARPGTYPIQAAMAELGVAPGPERVAHDPDAYMERLGRLPLIHQPGERWLYHTGSDVLAVLIGRLAGEPLGVHLDRTIFQPLGMVDTGFHVPEPAIGRLATAYGRDGNGDLSVRDPAEGGAYARPPVFPSEVVSTADDYLAFCRMLLNGGLGPEARLLSQASVALMMRDHITAEQKAASPFVPGFWETHGWGFGAAVTTQVDEAGTSPGSYGWSGGYGTHMLIDPSENLVVLLLTQQLMTGADDVAFGRDTVALAYAAIRD